ncbi:hypothetical protein OA253_04930, partial [Alphaproteobacteria bacterium]|nr:hypothetical protein [Alphaproteobacteria bacterium]
MIIEFNLKLFFVKILCISLFLFQFEVIASSKLDCKEKAFYVSDVISDAKDKDLTKAKSKAEAKGRLIAFNKLLNRLTLRNQIKDSYKIDLNKMINFIKINNEANSINRFVGSFDFCFNRSEVVKFFKNENLNFAEVFSLPISIFPIYEGPSGYIFLDDKDLWYNLWKNFLKTNDSLLNFKLSSGNLYLKRSIKGREILKSNKNVLKKIIKNDQTKRILVVILEPKLVRYGKYQLKISGKLYNETGKFDQTIFSKARNYESFKSATVLNKDLLLKDINELIYLFEESWKKNNFFKEGLITFVNVYIPIKRKKDWSNSLILFD